MRRRLIGVMTAVLLLLGITANSFHYYDFVSQTIYSESVSHLTEIFHQTNRALYNLVDRLYQLLFHLQRGQLPDRK